MPKDADALKEAVKEAIVQHFRRSQIAGDTAQGIHRSWMPERDLEAVRPEIVAEVLKELVKEDVLREAPVTGGDPQYRRGPRFREGRR